MITRGYYIGEIVDTLSDISGQVRMRGKLGLTDLNIFLEDFFKTTLNHIEGLSLENLNRERSNTPGLDLGDKTSGSAFQVTSTKTSEKINKTLKKISQNQIKNFPKIRVLIIGEKQNNYTLDKKLCKKVKFSEEDIWSVETLCKRSMDLPIDKLQLLYDYIRSESARVKIELEIPDEEGKFPTNAASYFEKIPLPTMSSFEKFCEFMKTYAVEESTTNITAEFENLSLALSKLPRITREFLSVMIKRREREDGQKFTETLRINADKLQRISHYPDHKGELRILTADGIIDYNEPEHRNESWDIEISLPESIDGFSSYLIDYAEKNSIPLERVFVTLDFSDF